MSEESREVTVQFFGPVRRPKGAPAGPTRVAVSPEETAEGLLAALGFDGEERSRLKVMDGSRSLKPTDLLGDLTVVTVFLPLGGG